MPQEITPNQPGTLPPLLRRPAGKVIGYRFALQ
jgi:hypothetical protein